MKSLEFIVSWVKTHPFIAVFILLAFALLLKQISASLSFPDADLQALESFRELEK